MALTSGSIDAMLKTIGFFHPEDASVLTFLEAHEDTIVQLDVLVEAIMAEYPQALVALKKAAPRSAAAVLALVDSFPLKSAPGHPVASASPLRASSESGSG